jgi:hypothetical protein
MVDYQQLVAAVRAAAEVVAEEEAPNFALRPLELGLSNADNWQPAEQPEVARALEEVLGVSANWAASLLAGRMTREACTLTSYQGVLLRYHYDEEGRPVLFLEAL